MHSQRKAAKKLKKAMKQAALEATFVKPVATGLHKTALRPYPTGDLFSSRGEWGLRSFACPVLFKSVVGHALARLQAYMATVSCTRRT